LENFYKFAWFTVYFPLFIFQEAKKVVFMVFVGVCIIFQAITSDVYVYNKKTSTGSPTVVPVAPTTYINASTIKPAA